jgi:hypothetical protein
VTTLIIVIVAGYLLFHLGAGHTHYRYRKAHGLRPNFYWSSVMGPYASIKIGGFRIGHKV